MSSNQFEFAVVSADMMNTIYINAKKDMGEMWEGYMAWATTKDEQERAQINADIERLETRHARGVELYREYRIERDKWKSKWFFRGPAPAFCPELKELISSGDYDPSGYHRRHRYYDYPVRAAEAADLQEELNQGHMLAQSGPTEFHLTQDQLDRLLAWKHGEPIRELKDNMEKDPLVTP
jgi:hypothetical protein